MRAAAIDAAARRVILNLQVEYFVDAEPRPRGRGGSDAARHPRPSFARTGAGHRRGPALRDVARGGLEARADARARRPGAPGPAGAGAHAHARRAAAPPRRAVDV